MIKAIKKDKVHGTETLFFIQIFSTFSFSVLYSTLVLYMTRGLNLSEIQSTAITACFVAFNYALHLIGGMLSGRLMSHRSLFLLGMILQVIGCLILSLVTLNSLYWGLAFFLSGAGINVTCLNCLLTQFFSPHDKRREKAFLWNYSGMNIGFLIGFAISGYFELNANYSRLFLISSFSNFIAILIVLFRWKFIKDKKTHFISLPNMKKNVFRFFSILIFAAIIFSMRWLINNPTLSNNMIIIAGIVMFFVVLYLVFKQPTKLAAERIWAYLILGIMSLVFWSLYMMAPMGLTLFIKNNVIRSFHGFTIAPQWVLNINSIIIIIGGPLMAYIYKHLRKKGFNISIPAQFTLALFLIGLAFIILPIGISLSDSKGMVNFGWVALSYILQSIGELCISPIGYAMIGQLIPEKLQGTLMGTWMMLTGLAAVIANIFSKMAVGTTNQIAPLTTNPTYFKTFNILGISAIVAGIIMLCLISFLQKLIKEKKHPTDSSAVPR